jgi:hypothetical protein
MGYAVHHVDGSGQTQLDDHASLDEALAQVETLRNDGAVSEVRVLKEVPIEVRTYYRVVAVEDGPASEPAPTTERVVAAVEPPSGATVMGPPPNHQRVEVDGSDEELAASEPRRALFGRG